MTDKPNLGWPQDQRDIEAREALQKEAKAFAAASEKFLLSDPELNGFELGWRAALEFISEGFTGTLSADYLIGHKDALDWAAQMATHTDPRTSDWYYDDPYELSKAISKGPDLSHYARPLASKMKGEPIADQPARAAIDGAIAYGRMGVNPPPAGHWLTEYWSVGQQLAELGKTSAWDNVTPVENRQKDNDSAARNGDGMATSIPEGILDALRFYANGSHFTMHDSSAWDTVSGEPPNFYEDESNTATVEDGSIAKLALRGKFFPDAEYKEPMVEGEVFAAAPEALRAAGVALSDAEIHSLWILSPPDEDGNDYVPFARAIESRILAKCKGEQS